MLHLPYGTLNTEWFPPDEVRTGAVTNLADINGPLSPSMGTLFDGVRDKMVVLDGIDGPWSMGHQRSYPLTGYACDVDAGCSIASALPGPSIDQIIADEAGLYDGVPPLRSMTMASGVQQSNLSLHGSSLSYRLEGGSVSPVPHYYDPAAVHDVLFANVTSGSDPGAAEAFAARKEQRLAVVDRVLADYQALRASGRLSQTDKLKLDAYLEHLAALEGQVGAAELLECNPPPRPPNEDEYPTPKDMAHEPRLRDHVANLIHAVRCGITNVLALDFERKSHTYQSIGVGDHHNSWHGNAPHAADIRTIDQFQLSLVADFVNALDTEEDPATGRTFLDNSLVVCTTDMGSVNNHKGCRMSPLLFGGTGVINQGKLLDYRTPYFMQESQVDYTDRIGVSYNNLLISICQAFGLTPEQYEHGQDGIGRYHDDPSGNYYANSFPGGHAEFVETAYGDKKTPLDGLLL
ncbi:MAG: DUF1552 domain-containing protein [Myxococcota bacterium]